MEPTREELLKEYLQLETYYCTLNDRIQDIRNKQGEFLTQQTRIRHLVYKLDREAGKGTCPDCFTILDEDGGECPECGEEQ